MMSQNTASRKQSRSVSTYGLSKPSKQSLVARGLAANEDKAGRRLQEQKQMSQGKAKPNYAFYNSSDSDADQVYSMNKKLDRCNSLLKKITEEDPVKKELAAKTSIGKVEKTERKKFVKIVLPNAVKKPVSSGSKKSVTAQKARVVTSTPNLRKKTKAKKTKEDELRQEISRMEMEKSLLQEQYSKLLQQQTSQTGSKSFVNENAYYQMPFIKNNNAATATSGAHPPRPSPLTIESNNTSSNLTSSSVFKELERTIAGISEKLSFPGSLTPAVTRDTDDILTRSHPDRLYTQEINKSSSVEPKTFVELEASRRTSDSKEEATLLLVPSANPNVNKQPNYSLYSLDSLDEVNYCSSMSESEDDKTLIAEKFMKDKQLDEPRDKNENGFTNFYPENRNEDLYVKDIFTDKCLDEDYKPEEFEKVDEEGTEGRVKTVRFEQVPLIDPDHETISSGDEVKNDNIDLPENDDVDFVVKDTVEHVLDGEKSRVHEEQLLVEVKINQDGKNDVTNGDSQRQMKANAVQENRMEKGVLRGGRKKTNNSDKKIEKEARGDESDTNKKQFYESPNRVESKPIMEVVSQISKMKEPGKHLPRDLTGGADYGGGIKPGYAATQITALSYLFKELMSLLSDRINSEEGRLLTEIDHMINMMPFLINNLNPDLQTEINLAVQPLRVENSDLRRQLRIANQKIRDFEIHIEELTKSLQAAKNKAVDQGQFEQLRMQMDRDESERIKLKEGIGEINKAVEELRNENRKLIEQISEKDAEIVKQRQIWQKERSTIYTDHEAAKTKLESQSLALQALEKQNKILKLSLSQSEAEIMRVKELNRDLRDSVSKLLKDVNYQDQRIFNLPYKSTEINQQRKIAFRDPLVSATKIESAHFDDDDSSPISSGMSSLIGTQTLLTNPNRDVHTNYNKRGEIHDQNSWRFGLEKPRAGSFAPFFDQHSDVSSLTSISDQGMRNENNLAAKSFTFDDQFSTLTCDSTDFRTNLADLSSNIRRMQESLYNAKKSS